MRSQPFKSPAASKTMQRAPLPVDQINPFVKNLDPSKPPTVKFQEITRDGQNTVVARVKVATPAGHAFILRRLDTGAISLTTMFRAAFPAASDDAERAESAWVKHTFDSAAANKAGKARFAGTWVTPDVALAVADSYRLTPIIAPLARAAPDPNVVYRKSARALQGSPASSPAATPKDTHPPAKRRRDASPTPVQVAAAAAASPVRPPATPRAPPAPSTPATRRSARLKSPAPPPPPLPTSPRTPRTRQLQEDAARTPPGSDETAVDDDVTEVSALAAPSMAEDLREQRAIIERVQAEQAARAAAAEVAEVAEREEEQEQEEDVFGVPPPADAKPAVAKRVREEESVELKLHIKEPETEARALVSNSRIRRLREMPPERKSLAWGALLFAAGMGAVSLLPSLPSFLS